LLTCGFEQIGWRPHFQDWGERLPPGLADSATADRLDEVLALRDLVEQLPGGELPKGFGRDSRLTRGALPASQ